MSIPTAPPLAHQSSTQPTDDPSVEGITPKQGGLAASLWSHALVGAAAALLLSLVELIDLNVRLTPVFQPFIDRAVFCAYFSLNVAGGLMIGLAVGLFANAASALIRATQKVWERGTAGTSIHNVLAGAVVCVIAALILNQQPQVHSYVLTIIREAEKFEQLRAPLLNHERSTSYLLVLSLVVAFSVVWMITGLLGSARPRLRVLWIASLVILIAGAYCVDSRFETQLYGASIHQSMFIIGTALTMSLIGTIFRLPWRRVESTRKIPAIISGLALLVVLVSFTFLHFDKDQNLKTQIFYRTTQAKQYFKLTQWALDFDRDGYSRFLGGGDCDDLRAEVNPSHLEILDDGVDHNCIGGPVTEQDVADWHKELNSLHPPQDFAAKRLNVIYVFIDALRADHLGAYGYSRNTSPNLDKLASRSFVFENAYTPAPNTFEALPKFTQGTYWDAHLEGWPEIMARFGYDTLLFPRRISTLRRHVKGMNVVEGSMVGTFEGTIDAAIRVLANTPRDRPFCAYLYSTDTHRPYKMHDDFYYGSTLVDLYDGEISYLDYHLGRLFDSLEKAGTLDETMVVIMADHGESLGERGVYKHSTLLYNEQARVPMIIHLPGLTARSIKDYVSTIDLGPTILNAVGLDYRDECAGVSLVPLMRGEPFTHPPVYGEQTTQEVSPFVRPEQQIDQAGQKKYMIITQDGFKLIYNRDQYCFELFDLKNDRSEVRNLYDHIPEKAAEMKKRLGRFIDVLTVSRPWDADESQYFFGPTGEAREAK
ncbi:MAG: sulfatase [Blastocatellia bacterium]